MSTDKKRYRAFISYSQTDKKWAQALHKSLETYRVPLGVMADIDPKKRTIGRIFRDDEEMGASQSLGAALEGAIEDSEVLIVLCSPNSARSQWVDLEVRRFKRKAGAKVFAVIIEGLPNSGDPETECFCPALRFKVTKEGELTQEPDEPLAPDWRKDGLARLKTRLTAGILGVNFDDLWQRDRRRRQQQRMKVGAAAAAGLAILSIIGAFIIRGQNYERSEQLVSAARRAVQDQLSPEVEPDRGSNTERALRLSVLASKSSFLHPVSAKVDAALISAAFYSRRIAMIATHDEIIRDASYSPDSSMVASISYNGTVRIWDAQTGEKKLLLGDKSTNLNSVAFSPDSKQVVVTDFSSVNIVDIATGEKVQSLAGENACIQSAIFMANGTRLLTQCVGDLVQLWDITSGREVARFEGGAAENLKTIFLSPDQSRLVAVYSNAKAILWDVATGEKVATLIGSGRNIFINFNYGSTRLIIGGEDSMVRTYDAHTGKFLTSFDVDGNENRTKRVTSVTYAPDDSTILTTSSDGITRSWDAATGTMKFRIGGNDNYDTAVYNPTGTTIMTVESDDTAKLWDAVTGKELTRYEGHEDEITNVAFAPDGLSFLTVGRDNMIRLWQAGDRLDVMTFGPHRDDISSANFNADSTKIITSDDFAVHVFDIKTGEQLFEIPVPGGNIFSAAFGSEERQIVIADWYGTVRLWGMAAGTFMTLDMKNGAAGKDIGFQGYAKATRFNPAGDRLLTYDDGGTARLWDAMSGEEIAKFTTSDEIITSIVLSDDGALIASTSGKGSYLWDGRTGQKKMQLKRSGPGTLSDYFTNIAIRPDGAQIVTLSDDNVIVFWRTDNGEELTSFAIEGPRAGHLIYSPNGHQIIVGDEIGTIRVFEASTGRELVKLLGHTGEIPKLVINQAGNRLISASMDESNIRLWDIGTGVEIARLTGLKDRVSSAEFSPDGRYVLAAGYYDDIARLWDITPLASAEQRKQNGALSLLMEVCDPLRGKLRGPLRYLTAGDIAAVPFLKGRLGEDVCKGA